MGRAARLGERAPLLRTLWLTALAAAADGVLLAIPLFALLNSAGFVWMLSTASSPAGWLLAELSGVQAVLGLLASADLLLTRPPLPQGVELRRAQAPALFGLIDRRTAQYRLAPVDRVLLTTDSDIRWIATPRRILPGTHRHTLCVGLPLLFFLSHKQFRARLHSTLGQWYAYRNPLDTYIRRRAADWVQFAAMYGERRLPAAWLLRRPVTAFARLFARHSAELCRNLDLVRDDCAREVLDDEQLLALIAAETVCAGYLDNRFWPMIRAAAERTPDPVLKPFSNFAVFLDRLLCREDAARWLLQALAQSASEAQAHCGLRHRIGVLGYSQLSWSGMPGKPAFHALFDDRATGVTRALDGFWQNQVRGEWAGRYRQFQADKTRFRQLHEQAARQVLSGRRARDYVRLAERFLAQDEAVAVLRRLFINNQGDAALCFECGRRLLAAGDEQGVAALETAMQINQAYANEGAALISEFERQYRNGAAVRKLYAVSGGAA